MRLVTAILLLSTLIAPGCAQHKGATTSPATIEHRYTETGRASWYGKAHDGQQTASGERFDMHALTAAHRTLPFGTVVQVTVLKSGKSVKVRINDRGPFNGDRIIDLSYEAARQLGITSRGTAEVGITVIANGSAHRSAR